MINSTSRLILSLLIFSQSWNCLTKAENVPCALLKLREKSVCIPYRFINAAFEESRYKVGFFEPINFPYYQAHEYHAEIDKLGIALSETAKKIAETYHLSVEEVNYYLPLLNVQLSEINDFCPSHFRPKACYVDKYRSMSGYCNNLQRPDWGSGYSNFLKLMPPHYQDGIQQPREEVVPPARLVSLHMHRDIVQHDHSITTMLIAFGQALDHDITLTAETKEKNLKDPECCRSEGKPPHHNCLPIILPENDPFYSKHGRKCMNFARSLAGVRTNCRLGSRTSMNIVSSFIDASFVYGSNPDVANELRSGKAGKLRSLPLFRDYGLMDLLPLKLRDPDDGCLRPSKELYCFLAGDNRVNEQLVLTVLHTIFMREHNRIAEHFSLINPHWNDERIFQEAKRLVGAITQHITYNEFLPLVLGKDAMSKHKLEVNPEGYWNGYDEHINPTTMDEFAAAAFRFGHSLLPMSIERWNSDHRYMDSMDLSRMLRQPFEMYKPGYVDTFATGLLNQLAQSMDQGVTEEVTNKLFKKPKESFGMDLASLNIQRGREHGLPGFTYYREVCGLKPIQVWEDLVGVFANHTIWNYRDVYLSPHDIDLWSGGVSEIPHYGSLVGPTFSCIIAKQFFALRAGDRYWYENPNMPSSFTPGQLAEIKKTKLSRLLCDNTDSIKTTQIYAMAYPDTKQNVRVPCRSAVIPRMDLNQWQEVDYNPESKVKGVYDEHTNPFLNDVHESYKPEADTYLYHRSPTGTYVNFTSATSHPSTDYSNYINYKVDAIKGYKRNGERGPQFFPNILKSKDKLKSYPVSPDPIPKSPIPGISGIFSPNPGYLIKQRFKVGG